MQQAQREGLFAPARRALTIGLVLTVTLVAFEALAVVTILPVIKDDLGGLRLYGWVTSAFFLGTLVGIVVAGSESDRRGPGPPYVLGILLFAAGLVIGGLAPSMLILVLARALQGIGAGAIPATAYAAIGRSYPEALRPRVFAVLSTAWVVPGLIGPALSALVATHLSWRYVFLGLLPLVLVAAATRSPGELPWGPSGRAPVAAAGGGAGRGGRRAAAGRADRPLHPAGGGAGRRRAAGRGAAAAAPAPGRHAARPPGPAHGRALQRDADLRVLRHRHLRAAGDHRGARPNPGDGESGGDRRHALVDARRLALGARSTVVEQPLPGAYRPAGRGGGHRRDGGVAAARRPGGDQRGRLGHRRAGDRPRL